MTAGSAATRPARRALRHLARWHGIQTTYTGTDGKRHEADDEVLLAVLRALDAPLDSPDGANDALACAAAGTPSRPVEPVVVHRAGGRLELTISLDHRTEPDDVWIGLRLEDGALEHRRLGSLPQLRASTRRAEKTCVVEWTVALDDLDPVPGYHRIEIEGPGVEGSAVLVSAPRTCPRPERSWGVFAPLHAVRSVRDWGVGSFGDLARVAAWVGERGAAFVGTLPLLAAFTEEPWADASPYRPVSRLMWNELFVDLESLPELAASPEARAELSSLADACLLGSDRPSALADPAATMARKRGVLRHLAGALCEQPPARREEFDAYVRDRPELLEYARFRAVCERVGRPWTEWDRGHERDRDGADDESAVRTHLYAQWVCDAQLERAARGGVGLYLDLPVGVHPAGFDPWRWPQLFAGSVSGGAPPDTFSPTGQNWGFPPLHPERIREDGYRYVIEGWRHCLRRATAVRIDHIAGLHRLYWVPEGFDASDGVYVRYRGDELHAVLVLEADRAGTVVVGEDLGTVPTAIRRAMARDGILSSWVMQFASNAATPLPRAPRRAMASLGTHDLPTFDAYWHGTDIEDRLARSALDAADARAECALRAKWRRAVLEAAGGPHASRNPDTGAGSDLDTASELEGLTLLLRYLAAGPADLVLVDMEDLWLEPEPQNRPGTGGDVANFRRRWSYTLEQAEKDPHVVGLLGMVDHLRRGGAQ